MPRGGYMSDMAAAFAATVLGRSPKFEVDDTTRLMRFLIMGSQGGTYYIGERPLTIENANAIVRLFEAGRGLEVVNIITEVSVGGRAAKQSPTLFALAMATRLGDVATRRAAFLAVSHVCRTPTMLFEFVRHHMAIDPKGKGWGRCMRRAITAYYSKNPADLAYAVTKYRQRDGWTHADILRLAHVKPTNPEMAAVLHYIVKGEIVDMHPDVILPHVVEGPDAPADVTIYLRAVESAKTASAAELAILIDQHNLPREVIPSNMLNDIAVWRALLPKMPLNALLRNLAKMTAIGLLKPLNVDSVVERLTNPALLKKARVHPFAILIALNVYASGHGDKGSLVWTPVPEIVAALNKAYVLAFDTIPPTGKRYVLGIDVSGSMQMCNIFGTKLTAMDGAAAMAMVAMRTETKTVAMAFSGSFVPLNITAGDSLDDVKRKMQGIRMGNTDCALPMNWAYDKGIVADVFIVYTDNETNTGSISPADALRRYRAKFNPDAKLIVVAMTSGGFSIADPSDAGMLDVVGFDTAAPQIMQDFIAA